MVHGELDAIDVGIADVDWARDVVRWIWRPPQKPGDAVTISDRMTNKLDTAYFIQLCYDKLLTGRKLREFDLRVEFDEVQRSKLAGSTHAGEE